MGEEKETLLQWHSAFYSGLQIELAAEAEHLVFENEHMLSNKPMQIDVLIIKKHKEAQIKKNIGRIFREHNIVEYKSPDDYLSIDDFYKVYGYTCFYKADTNRVDSIKEDELTITFVCCHYPKRLIGYLTDRHKREITMQERGIYYISDDRFAIQLVVTSQLSEEENLWLRNLTNDLKENESAKKLIREYDRHKSNELYEAVMEIIVKANTERFQEVNTVCNALEEIFKDKLEEKTKEAERLGLERGMARGMAQGIAEGMAQGEQNKLFSMVQKKVKKGKTVAQIADELEETEEVILPLYQRVMDEPAEYKISK